MLSNKSLEYILEIADNSPRKTDLIFYRIIRVIEEAGNLSKVFRQHTKLSQVYTACAELFVSALVNILCVAPESIKKIPEQLEKTKIPNILASGKNESYDFSDFEKVFAHSITAIGKLTDVYAKGKNQSEFAFHCFSIAEEAYRLMKIMSKDINDDYLNLHIENMYKIWTGKRGQHILENTLVTPVQRLC